MLHPTVWLAAQSCNDKHSDTPLDALLNIAKWLSPKKLLAFSRTCRYFASTIVDIDDFVKLKSKSTLWRLARECQYPNKLAWAFLSDCEQYMVASCKEFVIMTCKNRYESFLIEYDAKLAHTILTMEDYGDFDDYTVLIKIKSSDALNPYLLIHTANSDYNYQMIGSYCSKEVAELHIPSRKDSNTTRSIIFNLNNFGLYLNNCEPSRVWTNCSYRYKNGIARR